MQKMKKLKTIATYLYDIEPNLVKTSCGWSVINPPTYQKFEKKKRKKRTPARTPFVNSYYRIH
jgi:hypothetical protein